VLGHVYDIDSGGLPGFHWAMGRFGATGAWARGHGFMFSKVRRQGQEEDEIAALDEAWISLIKERFASGLLSDEVR